MVATRSWWGGASSRVCLIELLATETLLFTCVEEKSEVEMIMR